MTEFPRDDETEQYIDFLLDRVEWLEQELEQSEKEKLDLLQNPGPSVGQGQLFDYSDVDSIEERFHVYADELVDRLRKVPDEELGLYVMQFKLELLQLEEQFEQEQGGFPDHLRERRQETHKVLDNLIQTCIRNGDIPP